MKWTKPDNDGGSTITNYVINYKAAESSHWKTINVAGQNFQFTLKDLMQDLEYVFKVAAENAAGIGEFSPASQPVHISGTTKL